MLMLDYKVRRGIITANFSLNNINFGAGSRQIENKVTKSCSNYLKSTESAQSGQITIFVENVLPQTGEEPYFVTSLTLICNKKSISLELKY